MSLALEYLNYVYQLVKGSVCNDAHVKMGHARQGVKENDILMFTFFQR